MCRTAGLFRAAWEDFSPSGTVDVVAELRLVGHQVDPDIRVICRDVEFAYDEFPYRLREGRGVIHLVGNRMRIADFTAVAGGQTIHLAAEFENPGPTSTGWLTLHCSGGVPLNDELIAAMKPEGQRIVRSLRPAGSVAVMGGRIDKRVPGERPHSRWELRLVDCSLQYDRFPYAIEKITGQLILADGHWQFRDLRVSRQQLHTLRWRLEAGRPGGTRGAVAADFSMLGCAAGGLVADRADQAASGRRAVVGRPATPGGGRPRGNRPGAQRDGLTRRGWM